MTPKEKFLKGVPVKDKDGNIYQYKENPCTKISHIVVNHKTEGCYYSISSGITDKAFTIMSFGGFCRAEVKFSEIEFIE